jgi:hypothetical protein
VGLYVEGIAMAGVLVGVGLVVVAWVLGRALGLVISRWLYGPVEEE